MLNLLSGKTTNFCIFVDVIVRNCANFVAMYGAGAGRHAPGQASAVLYQERDTCKVELCA